MKQDRLNKENVSRRLLINAAEIWNVPKSEMESIDPMAKMLLRAVAKEIEKLGNKLYSSDTRIFKKIAQFLLPDELQTARPAHAIISCRPVENTQVNRYHQFTYERRWRDKDNLNVQRDESIRFSPAGEFDVNGMQLVYRIDGDRLSELDGLDTSPLTQLGDSVPSDHVFLGFRCASEKPSTLRLYFDWYGTQDSARLTSYISKITAMDASGKRLAVDHGLVDGRFAVQFGKDRHQDSALESSVQQYYNDRFLRISLDSEEIDTPVQDRWQRLIAEAELPDAEELVWIRLVFPPDLRKEQVRDCTILPNCFPAINRNLEHSIYKLNKELNIKRLEFQDSFLSMERVESNRGQRFKATPSIEALDIEQGTYSIRSGAVGRLDERSGIEYLNHLVDLIDDEKQAFKSMDISSTRADIQQLDQILSRISKRSGAISTGSKHPYLVLRPHSDSENVHVHFWSTRGSKANGLAISSLLKSKHSGLGKAGEVRLATASIGGEDELDNKKMVQTYRAALLSRGVIVTKRDIMELCKRETGTELRGLEIKHGVMASTARAQGFLKTIDVILDFDPTFSKNERQHSLKNIKTRIEANSNLAMPVRVLSKH